MKNRSTTAVLQALRDAFPHGVSSTTLHESCGPAAKSRIGDLRCQGWQIATDEAEVASYRLTSLARGQADPILAGCTLRLGTRSGWSSRTHRGATLPEAVLEAAQRAAEAAYRAVLTDAGYGHLLDVQGTPTAPSDLDALLDQLEELRSGRSA